MIGHQAKLDTLPKRYVFEPIVLTSHNVEPQLGINLCLSEIIRRILKLYDIKRD